MGKRLSAPVKIVHPQEAQDDLARERGRSRFSSASLLPLAPRSSGARSPVSGQACLRVLPQEGYEWEDANGSRKRLSKDVVSWFKRRNGETLQGSLAFVPWILQESYFEGGLEEGKTVIHRGSGAVVFSDASGFTALTERLAMKSNGAELLSRCLTMFFTPLINLINSYRGDVIKFSGDALTIYFPAVDDTQGLGAAQMQVPPHGSFGLPDLGPMATAVLRASACCLEIQKKLHMFDTCVDGVRLCLHIGVGCGQVAILQVGGVVPPETHVPRCEYLIAGPPIEQISIAEPLAKNGETCLSPQAWQHVSDCVIEDTSRHLADDYHLLLRMDATKYTFPSVKHSAMERDKRHKKQFNLSELNVIRRYIPSAVFKQIEGGTLTYVNEMRTISTIFMSGSGVDVSLDEGAQVAQDLMSSIQQTCYASEGTLNKFVIDDKGLVFLLVFGLPPLVHTDDPTRAVLTCFDMVKVFRGLDLTGRFGVTTGRAYCGVCGSAQRMEYTVLGDTVNLSARLMTSAPEDGILVDQNTMQLSTNEISFTALAPIKVKGKANSIPIFRPSLKGTVTSIGVDQAGRILFPWYQRQLSIPDAKTNFDESLEEQRKVSVIQLCGLTGWPGIKKVQEDLLGGEFEPELHSRGSRRLTGRTAQTPPGSPFCDGGVVIIEGQRGMGKNELAEHMCLHAAKLFHMLPVFGTIGPRLNDRERLGVELLRSIAGVFRHLDPALPDEDLEVLTTVLPSQHADSLSQVREAFEGQVPEEHRLDVLSRLISLVVSLLEQLRKQTSILIVLQLEFGTSLFDKTLEGFNCFWDVVTSLTMVAMPEVRDDGGSKPIVLAILCREAERDHPTTTLAEDRGWIVRLSGLSEDNCTEYMAMYLNAPKSMVPEPLRQFIAKISLGNPLYIRETIDQLLEYGHVKVHLNTVNEPESLAYHHDLEGINIASWAQTAMVGETVCLLESLDPLEAAVLKMSTVFTGSFTLPDLASSSCSGWGGATHFDYLRLYRAIQDLVKRGIVEIAHSQDNARARNKTFQMRSVLMRKVGSAMLLEAQKVVVKRQALLNRVLSRDLPARMEEVYNKRLEPHIPWYYENVLVK